MSFACGVMTLAPPPFDLRAHAILLVVPGSRAFGVHTDASGVDVTGIAIPPAGYFDGCTPETG